MILTGSAKIKWRSKDRRLSLSRSKQISCSVSNVKMRKMLLNKPRIPKLKLTSRNGRKKSRILIGVKSGRLLTTTRIKTSKTSELLRVLASRETTKTSKT